LQNENELSPEEEAELQRQLGVKSGAAAQQKISSVTPMWVYVVPLNSLWQRVEKAVSSARPASAVTAAPRTKEDLEAEYRTTAAHIFDVADISKAPCVMCPANSDNHMWRCPHQDGILSQKEIVSFIEAHHETHGSLEAFFGGPVSPPVLMHTLSLWKLIQSVCAGCNQKEEEAGGAQLL